MTHPERSMSRAGESPSFQGGEDVKRRTVVLDTETTGLNPDAGHEIWEVGVIELTPNGTPGAEHLWRVRPDLTAADPQALQVGHYYERTAGMRHPIRLGPGVTDLAAFDAQWWSDAPALALTLARFLEGTTIIGANPTFDARFLTALLTKHGQVPSWHYRLRDIGSMAYGWLHGRASVFGETSLPGPVPALGASTDDFALALGVNPSQFERHSALGDCRLLVAMLAEIRPQHVAEVVGQ